MEMHFHFARTLSRVERRTELAKIGRAWRAWREVVRAEGEAELQAMERHYRVAQTVARVVARAHERRLLRAWSLWARLAARRGAAGGPTAAGSMSLSSFPPGLLAATRNPRDTAALAAVGRAYASRPVGATQDGSAPPAGALPPSSSHIAAAVAATERERQAGRSRAVMYTAGAGAVRGLLRRAKARSLSRSWRAWRGATTADAAREARGILGATRIAELFVEARENSTARLLRRRWEKWVGWSTADGARLEREAEAASWAAAEENERSMKTAAAAAADALAAASDRGEDGVLRTRLSPWAHAAAFSKGDEARGDGGSRWPPDTAPCGPESSGGVAVAEEEVKTPNGAAHGSTSNLGAVAPSPASPASAVSLLRSKLRGETSSELSVLPARSGDPRKSPGDNTVAAPLPHRLTVSAPVPVALADGLATPTSPLVPLGFSTANTSDGNRPTPGSGRPWSDRFNYSSSPYSPSQPPAGAGAKSASAAANGSAQPETGTLFPGSRVMDDDLTGSRNSSGSSSSSLVLTASADSVNALRSHAAGGTASPPPLGGGAATANAAAGSPEGSPAAYASDSSPLLGESVLVSSGRTGTYDFGGASIGNGGLTLAFGQDAKDGGTTAGSLPLPGHAHPDSESEGRGTGTETETSVADKSNGGGGTMRTTPESRLSRRSPLSANSASGKTNANGRARFPKSPPYVGGSVGALSLGRGDANGGVPEGGRDSWNGRLQDNEGEVEEEEGEREEEGLAARDTLEMFADSSSEFPSAADGLEQREHEAADVRVGMERSAVGGELARAAEDFVDIMTSVLWRRAFARWAQVSRDAAFRHREATANLKVCVCVETWFRDGVCCWKERERVHQRRRFNFGGRYNLARRM